MINEEKFYKGYEPFFDRLNRGEKISCTAHDEILGGNNPCAIVKDLYKQIVELKAENERLKENQCPGLEFCDKDSQDTINAMLVNRDLKQQLKEKDNFLDYIQTQKMVVKAIREILKNEMNHFNGTDGLCDYYFAIDEFLSKIDFKGQFAYCCDKIIQNEISTNFKGYPLEYYGWTLEDVENAVNKHLRKVLAEEY